jgi:hypothetical protein
MVFNWWRGGCVPLQEAADDDMEAFIEGDEEEEEEVQPDLVLLPLLWLPGGATWSRRGLSLLGRCLACWVSGKGGCIEALQLVAWRHRLQAGGRGGDGFIEGDEDEEEEEEEVRWLTWCVLTTVISTVVMLLDAKE